MNPASVLIEMVRVYFSYAWPFALLHAAIAAAIILEPVREILEEKRRLRLWKKNGHSGAGCAGVLAQFVHDSRQWGSRGILVPMTDYSDRLDSQVSGVIETLHSRVNLFLVVGIAGTFFAMFQFAIEAARGFESAERMSRLLATGLAQAFPVGFVGLMLTIVGHFVAFFLESGLRNAVTDATQHAMQARRDAAQGPYDVILEALSPLRNLDETLRTGLQPVLAGFHEHLQATSELIGRQIQPLAEAVAGFQTAVTGLKPVSETMTRAVESLPAALARIEEAQAGARRQFEAMESAQAETRQAAERFLAQVEPASRQLSDAAGTLTGAAASLESIPEALRAETETQLRALAAGSVASWSQTGNRLLTELGQSFETHISAIERTANAASAKLAEAAQQITVLSNTAQFTLEGSLHRFLTDAVKRLEPTLAAADEALRSRIPALLEDLRAAAAESAALRASAVDIVQNLERARARWSGAAAELDSAFQTLRRAAPARESDFSSEIAGIHSAVTRIAAKVVRPPRRIWPPWPFNGRKRS